MRILLTSHRFHPSVGGTEEVVAQLARRFAARGNSVTVATSDEPGAPQAEDREGYSVRRFALRRVGKFRFPGRDYVRFARDGDFDVAHLHGQRVWSTDYLYRHLDAFRPRVVFTAHGFYQWHVERTPIVDAWYYRRVLPRALRRVAAVVALTEAERDELHAWGVPDPRIIPDGFDPAEFASLPSGFRKQHAFGEREPLVLYVGGLYRNKRVHLLAKAAAEADATLAVIGRDVDGAQERLAREAASWGARVRFMGTLPRHDVLAAYREADVFALASDFEGFGLVLLEAMAAGLPFVSTSAGAAPELARSGGGVVVGADALGGEIQSLLADPERRRRLGEKGRAAAPLYDWDRIAERYLTLFEEVMRR